MSMIKVLGNTQNQLKGEDSMWKSPFVKEVSVGLEINCYACAEI
jgi:coenzyme PQQ precursor peptide PqqA